MDVLSHVLDTLKFSGSVFMKARLTAPWALSAPTAEKVPIHIIPRPPGSDIAIFHVPLRGRFWLRPEEGESAEIDTGDVAVIMRGTHDLADRPGRTCIPLEKIMPKEVSRAPAVVDTAGPGEALEIVCGYFVFRRTAFNPLVPALPAFLHTKAGHGPPERWMSETLRYFVREARSGSQGSITLVNRLAELLFVEIVRRHMARIPEGNRNWLAALADPTVGKALELVHEDPALPWTVDSLAKEAYVSRSALAARFSELVGEPPMHYLGRWRIHLGCLLLEEEGGGVASIAARVGYGSEAAFNRAFKRFMGKTPVSWAQDSRAHTGASWAI